MKLEGLTINFLGDSITEGHGTTGATKVYHYLIAEEYKIGSVFNYGVGGTRMAKQIVPTKEFTRGDLYFGLRAQTMNRNADAVVVFGGTNDYGSGDAPFGNLDDTDASTFCGAVNELIAQLRRDFPASKLIFMTPLHRENENEPMAPDGKVLADYVEAIRAITKKHDVPVIDLFEINPLDANDKSVIPDGLHPNDKGHEILAKVVGEELAKLDI